MAIALKNLSKLFVYLALVSPLILASSLFFPFINGKAILFRVSVELGFIFFLLYLIKIGKIPNKRIFLNPLFLSVIFFVLIFLITTWTGISPFNSFWSNFERGEGGFQIIHYGLFFVLATCLFHSTQEWRRLLGFGLLVSVFVSLYGFLQFLGEFGIESFVITTGGRVSGTLGNPSYFNAYLLFHLLFAGWLLSQQKNKLGRYLFVFYLIAQIGLFFTTETLAAFLGLGMAFFLLVLFYVFRVYQLMRERADKKLFIYFCYIISFLIVLLLIGFIYIYYTIDLYNRLRPRLWTWGSATAGIIEKPLWGWGAENFAYVFDKNYNPNHFGGETWFDRTHNIFLEYLVAGGIILLLAYCGMFFFYYKKLLSVPYQDWSWPIFLIVPIAYFIQGLTLFDVLPIYLSFFLLFAFTIHYTEKFPSESQFYSVNKPLIRKITALVNVFVIILFLWLLYFGNLLPLRKNLLIASALRAKDIQEAVNGADKTFQFYSPVGQQEAYESLGRNFALYLQQLAEKNVKVDPENDLFRKIMTFNEERFEEIKPRLAGIKDYYLNGVWNFAAFRATQDKKYLEKAKTILKEAVEKAPTRLELLLALVEIARTEKDAAAEEFLINKIRLLRPDLVKLNK